MQMDIRLIRTFYMVARLGSFQKAAESLQYAQPTITVQIKQLESMLGVKLFERGKTVRLTNAGNFLFHRADSLLQEFDSFNIACEDYLKGDSGTVRIGASEPSASNRLPAILSRYRALKPRVKVNVVIANTLELTQRIKEDDIEFAICTQPGLHQELLFEPVDQERFVLLLPREHPLASVEAISLKDVKNEKLLFSSGNCPFRIRIQELLAEYNGELKSDYMEVTDINAIKYYVQAEMGIAFCPEVSVLPALPGTVVRRIQELGKGPYFGLLCKRDKKAVSRIAQSLYEEVKLQLGQEEEPTEDG